MTEKTDNLKCFTEDDILTFSCDEELLDGVDLDIEIHTSNDDAPLIKEQILKNQAIVERVKEVRNQAENSHDAEMLSICDEFLNTTTHSERKTKGNSYCIHCNDYHCSLECGKHCYGHCSCETVHSDGFGGKQQ